MKDGMDFRPTDMADDAEADWDFFLGFFGQNRFHYVN
jgi:hypothetical protein